MVIIFLLSSMDGESSTSSSKGIIGTTIKNIFITVNNPLSESELANITENLNYPLRKLMHITEYFILTILVIRALLANNVTGKKLFALSFIIPYLYSCTDEFHQTFVGRTGQFTDTLIDSIGIIIALAGFAVIVCRKMSNNGEITGNKTND